MHAIPLFSNIDDTAAADGSVTVELRTNGHMLNVKSPKICRLVFVNATTEARRGVAGNGNCGAFARAIACICKGAIFHLGTWNDIVPFVT